MRLRVHLTELRAKLSLIIGTANGILRVRLFAIVTNGTTVCRVVRFLWCLCGVASCGFWAELRLPHGSSQTTDRIMLLPMQRVRQMLAKILTSSAVYVVFSISGTLFLQHFKGYTVFLIAIKLRVVMHRAALL